MTGSYGGVAMKSLRHFLARIAVVAIAAFVMTGCGGGGGSSGSSSGDWYYHFSCNGDPACLSTNFAGTSSGTANEGPVYANCSQLLTFAAHFWNMPPATDSCDQSSATPTPILSLVSITVTPANKTLPLGTTQQYVATATYSDGTSADVTAKATWSAGNGTICSTVCVATISPNGLATPYATGSIAIKATQGVISGSTTLYVTTATLQSIAVTPANPSIPVNVSEYFIATGSYSDGTTQDISSSVTWTSGTPAVATMNINQTVCSPCVVYPDRATGVSLGTSVITATSGLISGSTTLTVTAATLVSISISPTNPTVAANYTRQLTAIGHYNNATTLDITSQVTWSSATTSAAIVGSTTGIVSGIASGTSTITATFGSISGSATLSVTTATLQSISTITPAKPSCVPSSTIQLSATGSFSDGSSYVLPAGLTWSSSTSSIATVYSSGLATCVALGTSTITATSGITSGNVILTVRSAPRYAYVANLSSATVSQYTVGADGALTAISPPTVTTGSAPHSVSIDPSGQYVYVGSGAGISQYTIGAGGALTPMSTATVTTGGYGPFIVAVDPSGKYVYVANGGGGGSTFISQYTIGVGGALTPMSTPNVPTSIINPNSITVDPSSQYVYVTHANGGLSQFKIDSTGALTAIIPATVATGTIPYSVAVDPSGKYAYVANLGDNTVSQFTIVAGGALTPMATPTIAAGSGPLSIAIDPSSQYVYVANTFSANVSQYTIGAGGALIAMSAQTVAAGTYPQSVTVDPSGKYAYVANYSSNTVSQYIIDAVGALTPMATPTVSAGTPDSVAITR